MIIKCKQCGQEVSSAADKCNCGAIVNKPTKNFFCLKNPKFLVVFSIIVLMGVLGFFLVFFSDNFFDYPYNYLLYWIGLSVLILMVLVCFLTIFIPIFRRLSKETEYWNDIDDLYNQNSNPQIAPFDQLTYQNYEKITTSMTIAQVKEILGEGKETFSGTENGSKIKVVMWQVDVSPIYNPVFRGITSNPSMSTDSKKTVTVKFKDEKVVEKSQIGL